MGNTKNGHQNILFTSLNFHVFASYHDKIIFNGKSRQKHTIRKSYEKTSSHGL